MAEEEVLGEEDATQEEAQEETQEEGDQDGGGLGGLIGLSGGLNSSMIRILLGAIGVVALVFITIGVSYWTMQTWFLSSEPEQEQQQQEQAPGATEAPYQELALENDFIITKQMPGTGRTRTLKVSIVLAFNQENAAVKNELEKRKSQIRDRIFQILGKKNAEELGYDNMQNLKDELVNEINKMLTGGNRIQAVFFKNYVYQ